MDSQVIQAPTPEEVTNLLGESKRRNACLSLYTRCAVAYEGRAQSQLEAGDRFVLDNSDGTVLVHSDTNRKPRNWQPPGATVQVTDTDPLVITAVRTNPREVIRITFDLLPPLKGWDSSVSYPAVLTTAAVNLRVR